MKYAIYALSFLLFISCSSDDEPLKDYSVENEQEIIEYIAQHNIDAQKTNSGLYYKIDELGSGDEITASSDISVKFKGTLTNGTVFQDTGDDIASFNLQGLIRGWIEGLQFFRHGGSGTLIIPAHLGFGSTANGNIPAGSVLVFEIDIIDFKAENDEEIINYLEENEISNAVKTNSGLYYVVEEEGSGEFPTETADVTVVYSGYFTDGEIFDESNVSGATFNLSQVIAGWTEGMTYFKEGGKGKLFIPAHLAYGVFDYSGIPGGSVLIFDVELKNVIN